MLIFVLLKDSWMTKPNIYIFQIYYDEDSKSKLQKGFIPLDNSPNLRPDWAEYWPIRNVLLNQSFNPRDYIGFLSSKFFEKTWCHSEYVLDTVFSAKHDVYSFSPYFDQIALYLSSFEQGERYHPGINKAGNLFLQNLGMNFELENFVSDSSTCIYSNYFVARYEFWKIWFQWAERLFQIAEGKQGDLASLLESYTEHREKTDTYRMKVFLIERLVSLVLKSLNLQATHMLDVSKAPFSLHHVGNFIGDLLVCDALKGQYLKTNSRLYLKEFVHVRNRVFQGLRGMVPTQS